MSTEPSLTNLYIEDLGNVTGGATPRTTHGDAEVNFPDLPGVPSFPGFPGFPRPTVPPTTPGFPTRPGTTQGELEWNPTFPL